MPELSLEREDKTCIRRLKPDDLEAVIALDANVTGRRRDEYYKIKLAQALADTGILVSLAAEHDGAFAGFLLARAYYGEFGVTETVAMLDTLAVHPDFQRVGVGTALLLQLRRNLLALNIATLRTEVSWEDQGLLRFFHRQGFRPAARLSLEFTLDVESSRRATSTQKEAHSR